MPELPEVETSCRGIESHLVNQRVAKIKVRQPKLRWPVPARIQQLVDQMITAVQRRGKYILIRAERGCAIFHLGMSGHLRIVPSKTPAQKHDHVDLTLVNGTCLRFTDPRRFGALLWTVADPYQHPRLINLGPEPLTSVFNSRYLFRQSQQSSRAIKLLIMDSRVVVGVGNIYATEALFASGIHPQCPSKQLFLAEIKHLASQIKRILRHAIKCGGTTLRDFQSCEGKPGYFRMELQAYGAAGKPCVRCATILCKINLGQRTTVYCPRCQMLNHVASQSISR